MGYDCSIHKRKGCNYCLRGKQVPETTGGNRWYINECKKELSADNDNIAVESIKISFCPICGREL
jgi:hypothetical protein